MCIRDSLSGAQLSAAALNRPCSMVRLAQSLAIAFVTALAVLITTALIAVASVLESTLRDHSVVNGSLCAGDDFSLGCKSDSCVGVYCAREDSLRSSMHLQGTSTWTRSAMMLDTFVDHAVITCADYKSCRDYPNDTQCVAAADHDFSLHIADGFPPQGSFRRVTETSDVYKPFGDFNHNFMSVISAEDKLPLGDADGFPPKGSFRQACETSAEYMKSGNYTHDFVPVLSAVYKFPLEDADGFPPQGSSRRSSDNSDKYVNSGGYTHDPVSVLNAEYKSTLVEAEGFPLQGSFRHALSQGASEGCTYVLWLHLSSMLCHFLYVSRWYKQIARALALVARVAYLVHVGQSQVFLVQPKWIVGKFHDRARRSDRVQYCPGAKLQHHCCFAALAYLVLGRVPTVGEAAKVRHVLANIWAKHPEELAKVASGLRMTAEQYLDGIRGSLWGGTTDLKMWAEHWGLSLNVDPQPNSTASGHRTDLPLDCEAPTLLS
eukprot:4421891-Amphidinium_carterae.4